MEGKLPILIIIPHGGYQVPEELSGYETLNDFDLYYQADTCANELFFFKNAAVKIGTSISRLFVDPDRPYNAVPPLTEDGVIKSMTLDCKDIFKDSTLPDEIAISNILKRYYFPFHESIEATLKKNIKLIIECHTFMSTAPKSARNHGKPRPLVLIENIINIDKGNKKTCDDSLAENLAARLNKSFRNEEGTVIKKISLSQKPSGGYILKKYGQ